MGFFFNGCQSNTNKMLVRLKQTRLKKEHYLIRQDNIQIFNKIIVFKYKTREIKMANCQQKNKKTKIIIR